jgi:hypothetical protein
MGSGCCNVGGGDVGVGGVISLVVVVLVVLVWHGGVGGSERVLFMMAASGVDVRAVYM